MHRKMAAAASRRGGRSSRDPALDWTPPGAPAGSRAGRPGEASSLPEVGDGAWWIRPGWGAAAFSMRARRGSSQKGTDRRPSKKLKCEKKSPAKVDIRETANPGLLPKVTPKRSSSGLKLPDLTMMLQSDARGVPETGGGQARDPSDLCLEQSTLGTERGLPKTDGHAALQAQFRDVEEEEEEEEELKEEASQGAGLSDDSEMEPDKLEDAAVEVDNSAFLNEDSNQPLPVDRFFGSVAFMQDLPAAPLTRAIASRREFRKAHFIAKEEEEEEEEDGGGEGEEEVI